MRARANIDSMLFFVPRDFNELVAVSRDLFSKTISLQSGKVRLNQCVPRFVSRSKRRSHSAKPRFNGLILEQ
jgi:hypothetical protein